MMENNFPELNNRNLNRSVDSAPRTLSTRLDRLLFADRPLWAARLLVGSLVSRLKSRYLSWVLKAPGIYLGPGCIIRGSKFIHFGRNTRAHGHLWMEAVIFYGKQKFYPVIELGDDVSFSEGVHITCIERISIGNGVLFGSKVYVSDHNHGFYKGPLQSHPEEPPSHRELGGGGPVEIGDNVWIGDNVVIVGPVSIGRGCVVGANSVVRKSIPDYTMVAGAPSRILRHFDPLVERWEKTP